MQNDFLSVDDDVSAIQQLHDMASDEGFTLSRLPNAPKARSMASLASRVSSQTFLPIEGGYGVLLKHLCHLIDRYPTLRDADIVSSECYTEPIRLRILHRFLLLELHREGRKPIWVRLDRTRDNFTSTGRFLLLNRARTRANDVVSARKCVFSR